jgi:hypothetical protein
MVQAEDPLATGRSHHERLCTPAHTARAQRVEVGDTATFVFPLGGDYLYQDFAQIGVTDGFERTNWGGHESSRCRRPKGPKKERGREV